MDTRGLGGLFGGPYLSARATRNVPIPASSCNIPPAAAYALNIAVIPRAGRLGYLTAWPTGQPQPLISTLNSPDGSILANAAIVPADANGSISVFVTDDTDLVIDINGYFAPQGTGTLQFYPLRPCRVLDTRNANGPFGGPAITGGESRSFTIPSSACGVPTAAAAYSLNIAVVPHGPLGYLTVWPSGKPQPVVATLNSLDGTILANAAIVPAGAGGAVNFFATDTTDLVVDINGYFAAPGTGGLNFHTVTPCRVVDTRTASSPLGGPTMNANTSRTFPLASSACDLPATAAAYSLNFAVVPQGPLGYLTAWPTGQVQPLVSTLNALKGLVIANAALVPSGTGGAIDVYVLGVTDVVIDTNGYFGGLLTQDRTAMFSAATTHMTVDDIANVSVGDIVTGRPSSVSGLIVTAASTSVNVPKNTMVAVGESVKGQDANTGANLIAAGTTVVAVMSLDANTYTVTLNNAIVGTSGNATLTFDSTPLIPLNTVVVNPAPNSAGLVNLNQAVTGTTLAAGVTVRFTEPQTVDRTATFVAAANQITVDDISNIAVGDLVVGRPSTVENLIVSAGSTTINVPNTASVAVGERATAIDIATGANLFAANTIIVAIAIFNSTSNTVTLNHPTTAGSAGAAVTFDPSSLFAAGTIVVNPPPSGGKVNISTATVGASGPGFSGVPGSPGVTVRFVQQ